MKNIKLIVALLLTIFIVGVSCNKEKPGTLNVTLKFVNAVSGDVVVKLYKSDDDMANGVVYKETTITINNSTSASYLFEELPPQYYVLSGTALLDETDYSGFANATINSEEDVSVELTMSGNGSVIAFVKQGTNFCCNATVYIYKTKNDQLNDNPWKSVLTPATGCETTPAEFKNLALGTYFFKAEWFDGNGDKLIGIKDDIVVTKDLERKIVIGVTK